MNTSVLERSLRQLLKENGDTYISIFAFILKQMSSPFRIWICRHFD